MKTRTVGVHELRKANRLDAGHFLAPGIVSKSRLGQIAEKGLTLLQLGGDGGIAEVNLPSRFKRVRTDLPSTGTPYLRPYDLLEFLPQPAYFLSDNANDIDQYSVEKGTILQTCSGRNLGPAVYVDEYLSKFVVSHDMVRIRIFDERMRLYVLAFLSSQNGQALLRLDKTGSVIDHIDGSQVAYQQVPVLDEVFDAVVDLMADAITNREQARLGIAKAQARFNERIGDLPNLKSSGGWTLHARELGRRVDAAYHHPVVQAARAISLDLGGVSVREIAKVSKPAGRYKTNYVDRVWGRPILSGRQIHQTHPVGLKFIALSALTDPDRYELQTHSLVYQADGRAEEKLGVPVMITRDRHGWLASGHVGRLTPNDGVDPGWFYLAVGSPHAKVQIQAMASGSVVDGTYEEDMAGVVLPPPSTVPEVTNLWDLFDVARNNERRASELIDKALSGANP